jgi:hypothetical protein
MSSAPAPLARLAAVGGDALPEGGLAAIWFSSVLRSASAAAAAAEACAEGGADTGSWSAADAGDGEASCGCVAGEAACAAACG